MDRVPVEADEADTDWIRTGLSLMGMLLAVAGLFWGMHWYRVHRMEVASPPPAAAIPSMATVPVPTAPASVPEIAPSYPIEAGEPAISLTLESSDATIMAELSRLSGIRGLYGGIRPTQIVRHIVATVDASPRRQVPVQVVPITPVPGSLIVSRVASEDVVSDDNAQRYLPWIRILMSVNPSSAATAYRRFYPLFQSAYRELGYPRGYFNDRLVDAIDDILATSEISGPLQVELPSVMWRYVDPDLESLSAGQKILLRMGKANAKVVRECLVVFRAKIV